MESDINFKKIFLIILIISLSISALLGIIIFLVGDFGLIQTKILLTTLTIGGFSLTGLCCATLLNRKRFSAFAIIGMIISVLGFLFITSLIWEIIDWDSSNIISRIVIIVIIIAVSTAHASLLLLIKSDKTIVNVSLSTTLLFLSLVALELIVLVINVFWDVENVWVRILGVFAILDVLGTIVTPILLKVTALHSQEKLLR